MSRFRALLLGAVALSGISVPAFAQEAPAGEEAQASDEIIVTGTRRLDRTLADSPVPIDIISAAAVSNQGYTEVNRILNVLVPSFNFPQPSVTDGTDVIRPATLRGLGPDQTLVLVNGKRRHVTALLNINGSVGRGSAAVDLNLIPTAAIERIEVLRDGAAAQYGSDAIAGVLNIVLKKNNNGGSLTTTFGSYITTLDGVPNVTGIVQAANGTFPLRSDGTFTPIVDGERRARDGATVTVAANVGAPIGDNGFVNLTVEYRDRDDTNRAGFDLRPNFPGTTDPREAGFNRLNHRFGDAATQDINLFVNAGYEFTPAIEVYGTLSFGDRNGESAGFNRRANDARNRNFSASTTAFIPFAPEGFLPLINTRLQDFSILGGVRGTVLGWNYDLSAVHGNNKFEFGVSDSFNTSFGSASQTEFDSGGLRFNQQTVNGDLQRTFEIPVIDTVSVALGGEFRREEFRIRQGEFQSFAAGPFASLGAATGAQVFPGFPEDLEADRTSYSFYFDIDADITSRWNIAFAGRFEDYSDFGSDVNGKVATRFEVAKFLSIRGAVSTGFRAPSLHQQFFQTTATNNVNGVLLEILTVPVNDPVAVALGATPLAPETSVNYSGGLVLNPIKNLSITADFYRITIDNRIVVSENLQGAAVVGILQAAGINNVSSARFFVNGLDQRTRGVDVVASYRVNTPRFGTFSTTAAFNYNQNIIERILAAPGPLATTNVTLFGRLESLRLEQGQPRTKITLSEDWELGPVSATLRGTRFGEVLSPGTPANGQDDLLIEAAWLADFEIRADVHKNLKFAFGVNNLFDVYPTALPTGPRPAPFTGNFSANNFFLPFSSFSPFGFNGRFVYGRVALTW